MVRHAVIVALMASASATLACGGSEEAPFSVAPRHGKSTPVKSSPEGTGASPADSVQPEGTAPPEGTAEPPAGGAFPDISFELSTHVDQASESQKCKFVQVP